MTKSPKTTTAPTGSIAPFGLRMLPDLKERIEEAARASGRSMNAEIVARLEGSFDGATSEVDAVAERAAQKALSKVLDMPDLREAIDGYARHAIEVLMGLESSGKPHNSRRTPQIPGVNAPAKQTVKA